MNNKLIGTLFVATGIAVVGYWHYSPHLALQATLNAAELGDADAFNATVDYPMLRESIKEQMTPFVLQTHEQEADGDESFSGMTGVALVSQMVDDVMRPETMMSLLQARRAQLDGDTSPVLTASGRFDEIVWTFERPSTDKMIAHGREPGRTSDEQLPAFVYERSGFADWKLTDIRLVFEQ